MTVVRYRVASSLDGYIAGPNGEVDWMVHDPTIDFADRYAGIDTVLLGRRTYELTQRPGAPPCGTRFDAPVRRDGCLTEPEREVMR